MVESWWNRVMPTFSRTALTPARYLALLRSEGERMAVVADAGSLHAPVPGCPGWTAGDVLTHTADVYRRQAALIRLGRSPTADEWQAAPATGASIDWFRASLRGIYDELAGRDPSSAAFTRWPEDPTALFWYRRMALETGVHRVDLEKAFAEPNPLDEALALDGIEEVLTVFLRDSWAGVPSELTVDAAHGTVTVRAGTVRAQTGRAQTGRAGTGRAGAAVWRCRLLPGAVEVTRATDEGRVGAAAVDAVVDGSPASVLLWLWGRAPDGAVQLSGNAAVLRDFRGRLQKATQ